MDPNNITPAPQTVEPVVPAPVVEGTVEPKPESEPTVSLKEINTFLGKDFKDKDSALKSFKETFSFVGKRKEDFAKEINQDTQSMAGELKQLKDNYFFSQHPELSPYRAAYEKIGGNPESFFNSTEFKPIFEAARGFEESQKAKTVLNSNPRIAVSKDNLAKADEAIKAGNMDDARTLAARAVLEAYDIKQ